jgi:pimeloyl-ACP methyl ester carboxylesterase
VLDVKHHLVEANGIRMHAVEKGQGPVVLLCHGFPESWYSWRHQISALAGAGFRAVAPDMRGYGQTEQPDAIDQYTLLHLVGDMVGLLDALTIETAVIVGHDWGAPVAWHAAMMRPDRFSGIIALSVPLLARGRRGDVRPSTTWVTTEDMEFYQLHFQQPGVAEAEMEQDVRRSIRGALYTLSGDAPQAPFDLSIPVGMVPRNGGFQTLDPQRLPPWLTEEDVDFYADQFRRSGYRGPLNWYRNIDRNWELLAPYVGAKVTVPALYMAGDRDLVLGFAGMGEVIADLPRHVPLLRKMELLTGCGHWTQQERPADVNAAMIAFLRGL